MKYVRVGDSGLKVSQIILGCMSFGDKNWQPWLLDIDEALPVLKYAFDKGINTWDVADTYSNGEAARMLGAAIKHYNIPRSKLVITSKCFRFVDEEKDTIDPETLTSNDGPRVNRSASLESIFLTRWTRASSDWEPILTFYRSTGWIAMAAWEFQMPQDVAEKNGWHKFISVQGLYNLLYREKEREMNPYCNYTGVGLFPWSPLAAGVLAHSWTDRTGAREQKDPFLKLLFRGKDENTNRAVVDCVEELAQKKGVAMGCMPICGLESGERIDQAVGALQVTLSDEEIEYLEEPYVPKIPFPF